MKVIELLDRPEKWTKGTWARDKAGMGVPGDSPAATQWCILGAVDRCYPTENVRLWSEALHHLVVALLHLHNTRLIAEWQDRPETTWEQVRTLLERAGV